ncbi:GNAT family N-acetyltransferase [Alkaliphilus transvaalensis]|uniref:GNAT family N-acetyltransferase n=1 Tax=Alkaliphilus transvaalensis TaxID=114628 RepID=UPI0004791407|nr:GNAT family N-acetyltransferase [Alkaliphilus transvaalensis]
MIKYENCDKVSIDEVYEAFKIGFSDYMIKLEMSKEVFIKRFFGPEGNELKYSYIALDENNPVGVILGGIKNYEGVKTLRCGVLCVHPEYRGKGISQELYRLHKEVAHANHCKQMFLEVIVGNDRAIRFYTSLGYEKIYDISYYSYEASGDISKTVNESIKIEEITIKEIEELDQMKDTHVNWQNDIDYIKKLEGLLHLGAYQGTNLLGGISISNSGKIYFLWTKPCERHRGIGKSLLVKALLELGLDKLNISFPNNSSLAGFAKHINFKKEKIAQYEMYLTL